MVVERISYVVFVTSTGPSRYFVGTLTELPRKELNQSIHEYRLSRMKFPFGAFWRKPNNLIDLGKALHLPAPRRPLQLKLIRHELRRIKVALNSPGHHCLVTAQLRLAERHRHPLGNHGTRLFLEFSASRHVLVFAEINETFRHAPSAEILLGKEGAPGMSDQNFQWIGPPQQNASGPHRCFVASR